jgi:hypothetical protein
VSKLAADVLAGTPLDGYDFANDYDQLFWVSNWFNLFSDTPPPSMYQYSMESSMEHSFNSALAVPMDILYTRAVLAPLVDVERLTNPGLVSRRNVRSSEPLAEAEAADARAAANKAFGNPRQDFGTLEPRN